MRQGCTYLPGVGTITLAEGQWRARAMEHADRSRQWTEPHLERRRRGAAHPVTDFLFEYYPYSPGRLGTWHPGIGVILEGAWQPTSGADAYIQSPDGWQVDATTADCQRLDLALRIMQGTVSRPAQHSCFGLHEWAMVYRLDPREVRHNRQKLRLSIDLISDTVDQIGLRCTHIDAYRFFTASATGLNAGKPTRASQPDDEQPGCLHANMDLFKYAMWFQPYIPGELVLDCFELAWQARDIDMRASPYDLSDLGYAPIELETAEGRRQYVAEQESIALRASALRDRLIESLDHLRVMSSVGASGSA